MTDIKKTAKGKESEKSKKLKLNLNKETLKDLGTSKSEQVKGGAIRCTDRDSGCGPV